MKRNAPLPLLLCLLGALCAGLFGVTPARAQSSVTTRLDTINTTLSPGRNALAAVPAGTTNGAAIGTPPSGCVGVEIYLNNGDSITYTIATSAPGSAPTMTVTVTGADAANTKREPIAFSGSANIYITAKTGSPFFRFM